jgi:hypothetical protein
VIVLRFSKAQVGMMETIVVIIVFIFILLLGLIFYFKGSYSAGQDSIEETCIISNYVLLLSISKMPEVQCSINNQQERCIDTSKLIVFDTEKEYGSYFGTICPQKVYFTQLLPEDIEEVECTKNTYPNCNKYIFYEPSDEYETSIPISTPVSLYIPTTGEYQLGKLTVEILQ